MATHMAITHQQRLKNVEAARVGEVVQSFISMDRAVKVEMTGNPPDERTWTITATLPTP